MPKLPRQPKKFPDLPVLTEMSDADIPVLTEVLETASPQLTLQNTAPITDAQCRQLAAQLAPHLKAMLREKLLAQFEDMWQESWREVESNLPELIRDKLTARPRRSTK